jgi:hypothetical protein
LKGLERNASQRQNQLQDQKQSNHEDSDLTNLGDKRVGAKTVYNHPSDNKDRNRNNDINEAHLTSPIL